MTLAYKFSSAPGPGSRPNLDLGLGGFLWSDFGDQLCVSHATHSAVTLNSNLHKGASLGLPFVS